MQLLFPKEEETMYIIWALKHPCVISDILKYDPSQKRNTIAKVLISLERKHYIVVDSIVKTTTRYGRAYRAIISQKRYENQKKLFNIVENSSSAQRGILKFVSSLISSEQLDDTFIDEISNLIDNYKKKDS